jgi:phosphatidylserine/phosphatidylglycerophosphate/cardiolipin synthase-like enzyme
MAMMRRIVMFKLFSRTTDAQGLSSSRLFSNETFYKSFTRDLHCAKQRVYIESPFITKRRINTLLPVLSNLRQRGIEVVVNTRYPDEHEGEYIQQADEAVQTMQQLGVRVLFTVKHHRKLAVVDDVLWEGSLNILSQNDSCEIMRRIVSAALAKEMLHFTGATKYVA